MQTLRLAAMTHLHPLSFAELEQLAPEADELWVAAGRRLLLDGPLHHELALICDGRGLVRCAGETIVEFGPGDVFGELSAHSCAYPTATVHAVGSLHLVIFSSRAVRRLRESAPDALAALLAACALDPRERAQALAGARPVPALELVPAAAA